MFLTSALAERHKPQNTHREKIGGNSEARPTPKPTTFASAIAHSAPVCVRRCVLRPKAQKETSVSKYSKRTRMAGFEPVTANVRKNSAPPATAPLQAGSSWPDQKMGSFGTFLYINNFLRRKPFFGCPPSVVISGTKKKSNHFTRVARCALFYYTVRAPRSLNHILGGVGGGC